jgi:hypothetical protein
MNTPNTDTETSQTELPSNVILFPGTKHVSHGEQLSQPQETELEHNEIINILTDNVMEILTEAGVSQPELIKDGLLVCEAIRALVYKQYGIDHAFHTISEECFEPIETDDGVAFMFIEPVFKHIVKD